MTSDSVFVLGKPSLKPALSPTCQRSVWQRCVQLLWFLMLRPQGFPKSLLIFFCRNDDDDNCFYIVLFSADEKVVLKVGWSFNRVVFYQAGFSTGWSFIRLVFQQGGLLSGWFFIRVVLYQGGLSTGWSFHRVVFYQADFSSGWSFVRVVFQQGCLSSGWSFIRGFTVPIAADSHTPTTVLTAGLTVLRHVFS